MSFGIRSMVSSKALVAIVCGASLVACRGETSREAPIVPIRNMYSQPRYNIQGSSDFFADKRTMRPQVEGTISKEMEVDAEYGSGRLEDESGYVLTLPKRAAAEFGGMKELLQRGRERYGIYCTPCHDGTGAGQGIVIKRGMLMPPTFHQDRIRHIPDGQLFSTISNGIRNMPAYGPQIPVRDRWAIVSYVRALQLGAGESEKEKKL